MKKLLFAFLLSFVCLFTANAQSVHRCGGCQGHGAVTCPTCSGYGQVSVFNPYYGCYVAQVCPRCCGYRALVCGSCGGRGQVVVNNTVFRGKTTTPPNGNSDGYIYQGRSVKVGNSYYKYYRKSGHGYYWNGYSYVLYD